MKNISVAQQMRRASLAGALLAAVALPAGAVDLKTGDGSWTFSISGNVNVDYIYSSCQNPSSAVAVNGGLTCIGSASSNNVSNIGNGLLPVALQAHEPGHEIEGPMAIVILGGLVSSTLVSLVLVPPLAARWLRPA